MTGKAQSVEVVSLYRQGVRKREIASQLGISVETVNRRLVEAGITGSMQSKPWTAEELAIVHNAAPDPRITVADLMQMLPHRPRSTIQEKLGVARSALGMPKRGRHAAKGETAPAFTRTDPPRPGTYRDRRGVTLKLIPSLMENHA